MTEKENITRIVPLTYGVMPRTKYAQNPNTNFRLAGDSALAAVAAAEVFNSMTASGHAPKIFIPGATFFKGQVDAEYMADHISNPKRSTPIPKDSIETTGTCTNTPTQMAEIKRRQDAGLLGKVTIICASWQLEDADSLMQAFRINGELITEQQVLYQKHKAFFNHQAGWMFRSAISEAYKRKIHTAKQLAEMNKRDKKGRIRTQILTRFRGQGISDWEFRDFEKEAHQFVLRREALIAVKRELKSHTQESQQQ